MKLVKTLFILMLISSSLVAQTTRSDVFVNTNKVTWLGLDFTEAKFLGDRERYGSESDMRKLLEAWNNFFIIEADKYNIAACIDRPKVEKEISVTLDHNGELDVLAMYSDSERDYLHLSRDGVSEIVSSYDFKGLSGIGLMFNIESFSKINVEGSMWITFIDLESKEVLFTERMFAPPAGFGVKNYWAGSIYKVMEKIKKTEFEMWRKKFYRP